jgi:hypothetical protein
MEISPLTKTLVSMARRGRTSVVQVVSLSTPVFSDSLYGTFHRALDRNRTNVAVSGPDFFDRLPWINFPQGAPDNQRLRKNPADGTPPIERLLGDLFVNAGGNPYVNLAIECSGHL